MITIRRTKKDIEALRLILIDPEETKDDGTEYLGIRVTKPWGHEIEKYKDENTAVWFLQIRPHQMTSMHCHPGKTTLLFVLTGEGTLHTLNGPFEIGDGDVVVIEKGAFHRTASGGDGMVLYELETPPNKRDLVRLDDAYGRGQGYERVEPTQKLPAA